MKWLNNLLDKLFDWLPPVDVSLTDEGNTCPHCRGLGYDASGYTCTCLMEKK
jgi:hypothetical protein